MSLLIIAHYFLLRAIDSLGGSAARRDQRLTPAQAPSGLLEVDSDYFPLIHAKAMLLIGTHNNTSQTICS